MLTDADGLWSGRSSAKADRYLRKYYLSPVSDEEAAKALSLYPNDVRKGSPYNTETDNNLGGQFKRIASAVVRRDLFLRIFSDPGN